MELSDGAIELGIKILAATDAVFRPVRDCMSAAWSEAWLTRWGFEQQGVKYSPGGKGPADWQQSARDKAVLRRHGLLLEFRSGMARTYRVRLTDKGDRYFRQLVGMSHFVTEFLADVDQVSSHPQVTRESNPKLDGWIPEEVIAESWGWSPCDNHNRTAVEDMHYPAAVRGLVESNATTKRNVFYRITKRGREFMASPPAEPESMAPERSGAIEMYLAERRIARGNLGAGKPGDEWELGEIPLPVSLSRIGSGELATAGQEAQPCG